MPSTRGSAAWKCRASIVRPRPGHVGGQRRRRLARDERVDRVVQSQLEPRAEVVEQRRPDLGPAVGGDDDVHAEAQAGRGQLLDLAVEALELALERLPAVDEQEQVRERARVARGGHRLVAGLAERLLAVLDLGAQLAHDPRHRLLVELAGDAADVRRAVERVQQAAAEVDAVDLRLRRACGARSAPRRACAAPCSCRCAASRRPRRGRRRRRDRASNGSVRCSDGRSSRPTRARRPSARSPPRHHGSSESTASSDSASGSGATHTWCTGGWSPASRSTSTCSSLGPPGARRLRRAPAARDRRSPASNARTGAGASTGARRARAGRMPARRGTARTSRCRPSGSRGRAATAAGRRPACPARAWTRSRSRCAGTGGSAGGSPGRAGGPRRAAARTAAGGCRATGRRARGPRTGR